MFINRFREEQTEHGISYRSLIVQQNSRANSHRVSWGFEFSHDLWIDIERVRNRKNGTDRLTATIGHLFGSTTLWATTLPDLYRQIFEHISSQNAE